MNSARDARACPRPGFPIWTSPDQSLVSGSPEHFAAAHVLRRLLAPRHSPSALLSLTINPCRRALARAYAQGAILTLDPENYSIVKDPTCDLCGAARPRRALAKTSSEASPPREDPPRSDLRPFAPARSSGLALAAWWGRSGS